jgi:hypothetical protein
MYALYPPGPRHASGPRAPSFGRDRYGRDVYLANSFLPQRPLRTLRVKAKTTARKRVRHREHGEHREKIVERSSNKKYAVVSFSIFSLCSLW